MTDFGRVHCVVVATKSGEVVYERFYDRFTELDKAEIRAAFQQATDNINIASDNQDFVGTFRWDSAVSMQAMQLTAMHANLVDKQRMLDVPGSHNCTCLSLLLCWTAGEGPLSSFQQPISSSTPLALESTMKWHVSTSEWPN